MANFTDLKVWQAAHRFILAVYQITRKFPIDEKYALVQQLRRAAVSVAANIAEGSKRRSLKDKIHFYNISDTSLEEVKYYLILSRDLSYYSMSEYETLIKDAEEVGRMLSGLIGSLRK
ncbi:MAG: four helix bundle protein [Candidatus Sungbacteria bacterium]|nr:four helix bundle protein [Candidatus Sungbacteria bacterium]